MRTRFILSAALVLLASATVAGAQQKNAAPAKPAITQDWEIGFRSTSTTGDEYRYMRYQDLKSGLASKIGIGKETEASAWDFSAYNVGNDDQAYKLDYNKFGKMKLSLSYAGQPLNYAKNTMTPWRYAGDNVWTMDVATRTAVQSKTAVGIGTNAAAFDLPTAYRALAINFPMAQQRNTLNAGLSYRLNDVATVDFKYNMIKKSGNQPWGAAFAFNNANELPLAIGNTTNEFTAGLELSKPAWGMIRAEYQGSFFKNDFTSLIWDNPIRATDYTKTSGINYALVPPTTAGGAWRVTGGWDNSAYLNGNGAARGLMSLAPSTEMNTFRLFGLYKMPNHTTLNGQVAFVSMTQNQDLLPYTLNSTILNASTFAVAPGLARLPRNSTEADVRGLNAMINFSTRPVDYFAFDMKYRFNDHENQTPKYDYSYNVRFDGVPEYVPGEETEHFNIRQNTMEAGATFMLPHRFTALKFGYIMDDFKREGRAFGDMTDYTFRLSLDAYQNQYFTLRGIMELTSRIGSGFSEASIEEGGSQGDLRFYDEADMDRVKTTFILGLNPSSKFDLNLTYAMYNDKYQGEGHEFGLLKNDNSSFSITGNVYPTDKVTLGAVYGMDKLSTHQASRNANPFSGVVGVYESWNDPYRNWFLNNDEDVTTAGVWVDLIKALPNTDVKFAFNYSTSDAAFDLYGPRIEAFKAPDDATKRGTGDVARACSTGISSCFIPVPNVTNTWSQFKVDLKHMFKANMGVGLGYQYEKLDITDFATTNLADGSPRIDPLGALTTGYGNRPYTGSTIVAKLIYKF